MANFKEVRELIEILNRPTLTGISIEGTKGKVTLRKGKGTEITTPQISQMSVEAAAMPMPQTQSTDSNKTEAPKSISDNHKTINAPMVGTFYKPPSPDERAYMQVGNTVSNETAVCILEVMKLFSKIQAGISGEIVEILVKDGQMIEYGQPLFRVK